MKSRKCWERDSCMIILYFYYLCQCLCTSCFYYRPGPWDTEEEAVARGCYDGEPGGWRTLTIEDHEEVIVQIISAFNFLNDTTMPTVDEVRYNLAYWGPKLYPDIGTRAPGNFGMPGPGGNDNPDNVAQRRAAFKGLVSYLDVQMARLTEHVDWKNTYIVFLGDNGSQGGAGPFDIIEEPDDRTKSKATVFRNGREVPFVFAGPGMVKDVFVDDLVNSIDLYATTLELVGARQPEETMHSSFSFAGVLDGYGTKRKINVSELYPATAIVGGLNKFGSGLPGQPRNFGPGSRAVGDDRYSLLAFNSVDESNTYVCREGSGTLPANDCFNFDTGIYEHVVDVNFYDVINDPGEEFPLMFKDLNYDQREAFLKLCAGLNELAREAIYYQNGEEVCKKDEVSTL